MRPVPRKATNENEQCQGQRPLSNERCGNEAMVFTDKGAQFCYYCAPIFTESMSNAMKNLREAGLI